MYAAQLIHTLEYLQTQAIMHRDLKPQNLMLDNKWNIKVVSNLESLRLTLCSPPCRLTSATRKWKVTMR